MYASSTEICSAALVLLGEAPITSLDDATDAARTCKVLWPMVLEDELSAHRWKSARKRATLAQLAAAPAFGYAYAYSLPSDCLRVLEMEDEDAVWTVEGTSLLTDEGEAKVVYLAKVTDVASFTPGLCQALVARMAAELAMPITKKQNVVDFTWALYNRKVASALASDGQTGTPEVLECDDLVEP